MRYDEWKNIPIYCPQNYFLWYWSPIVLATNNTLASNYQCCPSFPDTNAIIYPLNTFSGQIMNTETLQPRKINLKKN